MGGRENEDGYSCGLPPAQSSVLGVIISLTGGCCGRLIIFPESNAGVSWCTQREGHSISLLRHSLVPSPAL